MLNTFAYFKNILTSISGPAGQSGRGQRVRLPPHISPQNLSCNNPLTFNPRIARTAGQQILSSRGVVRGITNWGPFLLPKPTTKHQTQHHTGHYFVMRFDASASTQQSVRRSLGLDPRMIRFSVVKIGDRLGGREARARQGAMENVQGQIYSEWNTQKDNATIISFNNRHGQRGAKGPY